MIGRTAKSLTSREKAVGKPRQYQWKSSDGTNDSRRMERNLIMLWTIALIVLVLWLAGLLTSYTFGGAIHILVVVAVVLVIVRLIQGRRLTS